MRGAWGPCPLLFLLAPVTGASNKKLFTANVPRHSIRPIPCKVICCLDFPIAISTHSYLFAPPTFCSKSPSTMQGEEADAQIGPLKEVNVDVEWKTFCASPHTGPFFFPSKFPYYDEKRSNAQLKVFVQGQMTDLAHKSVFLTVHEMASGVNSLIRFVNSPPMAELGRRCVFLHVCLPGQEPGGAEDFCGDFPTMDQLGQTLHQVLSHFGILKCFGLGEGAGADILCRFAMAYPYCVDGLLLVHCTSIRHGIVGTLREIFSNFRLVDGGMNKAAWDYLLAFKFGEVAPEQRKLLIEQILAEQNEHNLGRFLYSFSRRSDLVQILAEEPLKVESILVTGQNSSYNENCEHLYECMDRARTKYVIAENATNVLEEAPGCMARAMAKLIADCAQGDFSETPSKSSLCRTKSI